MIHLLASIPVAIVVLAGLLCRVPENVMRGLLRVLTRLLYRVRVESGVQIPAKGGALLVCNHQSLADACLVMAACDRPVRFIIDKATCEKWWARPLARVLRFIPLTTEARPREMIESLRVATECLQQGELVCIFAEGEITRTGFMLPFRRGMSRIMKGVDAPVIPVHLDNVWGSIFSPEDGQFRWKLPRAFPHPVTISFGKPMPAETAPATVRQAVAELGSAAWELRKARMSTVQRSFVRTARRHPLRMAMADSTTAPLSFFSALTKTLFLARRLRRIWEKDEMVGLLLPPSVPGALVNYAALLMGKVPVNLNYTLSEEALASCIRQCGITKVVTSEKFLAKIGLRLPVEVIFIETVAAKPRFIEKITTLLMALFLPARCLESVIGQKSPKMMDDIATIIFSSGSTGEPKGVMLTHYNIASNVRQIGQVFAFAADDRLLGILPFFHSFGFTGTIGAPALLGIGVAYHFNPTDAKVVGELVEQQRVTFLLATPTFLQIYMRGCQPEQFGSVRFAMVGAEKLQDRLATAFEEQFGLRPMEAYGCTECSPAVTVNRRDYREAGFRQIGGKRGTIGHPLPGMCVRIVDPETGAAKTFGESGLMLLKGPNIMRGYLNNPEKTATVLQDGWYVTGDIAAVDEDGFITITDRLSRFSKIGGEMVPHVKIEEKLHELAGASIQTFAVTSLPDAKKGERIMVLHTLQPASLESVLEKLATADLPNLWKPRKDQFIAVAQIPVLGTGKTDLRKVKETAAAAAPVSIL
ncbi:MAG: AMP-binding protein [Verrucomicrobiaceae bacterium]|nr:AMP-binding protein [Verrucomicrobiaceae bacterium]